MAINTKPLCYAPFIGMFANSYNVYAPCCVSARTTSFHPKDYWNSKELNNIRVKLLEQEWPSSCNYCKLKKENNLPSDSDFWNHHYSLTKNIGINATTGNDTNGPLFLDYRTSNSCNLKCRMCSPFSSNKIEKEVNDNIKLRNWFSTPTTNSTSNFQDFIKYTENLSLLQIKILGGEPTIDNLTIEFLKNIITHYSVLPELRFTTNATNLNRKFISIIEKFSKIHIIFSVDGTGNTYEYIRTNANWKKTKNNIEKLFKNNLATTYGFNTVLMPYNIFNIVQLLEWYYELYKTNYNFFVFFDTSSEIHTSLSAVLPDDLKKSINLIEHYLKNKDIQFIENISGINQLIPMMKSIKFSQFAHDEFKKYNNTLDNIRKTSLLNVDISLINYI